MTIEYNHMMDVSFSIITEADEEAVFNKVHLPTLIARARARLDDIEREGCTEAFGLCDTFTEEPIVGIRR